MPKVASYRLAWSATDQTYQLQDTRDHTQLQIVPESPAWFAWLDQVSSFAFWGRGGHYTARKESRPRGEAYWYAYVGTGKQLAKKYLGKTADVTLARLEQVAVAFADQKPAPEHDPPTGTTTFLFTEGVTPDLPPQKTVEPNARGDPLLATKLHQPRPRSCLVSRSHLVERLQQGMERSLTLISAPAGFGKTTLLAQWLAECDIPIAWLSLDPEDNDPARFLTYVIAALQTVDARVGTTALEILHSPQPPPPETVITLRTNDLLRAIVRDFALVLDDYHVITAEPLHRALSALVEHLPQQLHLILATRADPPLPLSRLRARGHLTEVRAADLRFSSEEASVFLHTTMGLDLPPADIAALERRTEGWIAGLQLAALSLQGRDDVSSFLAAFTGSHRFVLDYLSEEVLTRQSAEIQSFLLYTSVLGRLSGPLCDAVTGKPGSQIMLEALERVNLFVIALDDERQWYRYHQLFAEVLQSRLQQAEPYLVSELHRRASAWYEQHELPVEAIQHALAIPDAELAARLIEWIAFTLIFLQGQIDTVRGWLNALPEAMVRTRPLLCVQQAVCLLFTNQLKAAEACLQGAEQGIQEEVSAERVQTILGWVISVRAGIAVLSGDVERAISLARQALALLPETEVIPRASVMMTTVLIYAVSGDVTSVTEREVTAAVALNRSLNNLLMAVNSICVLAWLYILQGRLRRARDTYAEVMQVALRPEVLHTMYSSHYYYFGLGDLLYEWNEQEAAEQHLAQGMALINETQTVDPFWAVLGYTALARLQQARGNSQAAFATLDALEHLAERRHFTSNVIAQGEAVRAQLELARGNLVAAIQWANKSGLSGEDEHLPYSHESEYLALARVFIAQGREAPAGPFLTPALHLLERLLSDAEAKARMGSVLEILVLQSLALHAQGNRAQALSTLERALKEASPEGYIRLFVDEGMPMVELLGEAYARGIAPDYVATLLLAAGVPVLAPPAPAGSLLEPLTQREREVLRLLVKGLSNSAMAQELVITVGTVKRHVNSIYSKLAVNSRTQAVARAHALHLL